MAGKNPGLHKKISSIFDGVPVPKNDGAQPPSYVPKKDNAPQTPDVPKENDNQIELSTPNDAGTGQLTNNQEDTAAPQTPDAPKEKDNQIPLSAPENAGSGQLTNNQEDTAPQQSTGAPAKTQTIDIQQKPSIQKQQTPQKRQTPPTPKPLEAEQPQPIAVFSKFLKTDNAVIAALQKWCEQIFRQISNRFLAPKPGVSSARQKAMTILVPILFIVLIFIFINLFSTPARKTTKSLNLGPATAVASSNEGINWQIPEPYPTTLRDPMQFGSVTTNHSETANLTVKGIVYSRDNPTAVIGAEIVHPGDEISGVTIVKINEDSVEFESNGKTWTQKVQR